jgi:hypothetical protein
MSIFGQPQFYFFAVLALFTGWTFAAVWVGLRSHKRIEALEQRMSAAEHDNTELRKELQSIRENPFWWRGRIAN